MTAFAPLVAFMTCYWCAHPAWCTEILMGWVCEECRETAEGAEVL